MDVVGGHLFSCCLWWVIGVSGVSAGFYTVLKPLVVEGYDVSRHERRISKIADYLFLTLMFGGIFAFLALFIGWGFTLFFGGV